MPSLNFKAQFAAKVADGSKPHTIRALRNHPFMKDDDLSFFTGMRTRKCRRLRPNQPCIAATTISISAVAGIVFLYQDSCYYRAGEFNTEAIINLATKDGFESTADFFAFFRQNHGELFTGQLIEWQP